MTLTSAMTGDRSAGLPGNPGPRRGGGPVRGVRPGNRMVLPTLSTSTSFGSRRTKVRVTYRAQAEVYPRARETRNAELHPKPPPAVRRNTQARTRTGRTEETGAEGAQGLGNLAAEAADLRSQAPRRGGLLRGPGRAARARLLDHGRPYLRGCREGRWASPSETAACIPMNGLPGDPGGPWIVRRDRGLAPGPHCDFAAVPLRGQATWHPGALPHSAQPVPRLGRIVGGLDQLLFQGVFRGIFVDRQEGADAEDSEAP